MRDAVLNPLGRDQTGQPQAPVQRPIASFTSLIRLRAIHLTGPMQVRALSMVESLVAGPWSAGGPVFPAVRAGSASAGGWRPGRGSALERGRRPVRARGRRPCLGCEIGVG